MNGKAGQFLPNEEWIKRRLAKKQTKNPPKQKVTESYGRNCFEKNTSGGLCQGSLLQYVLEISSLSYVPASDGLSRS